MLLIPHVCPGLDIEFWLQVTLDDSLLITLQLKGAES